MEAQKKARRASRRCSPGSKSPLFAIFSSMALASSGELRWRQSLNCRVERGEYPGLNLGGQMLHDLLSEGMQICRLRAQHYPHLQEDACNAGIELQTRKGKFQQEQERQM